MKRHKRTTLWVPLATLMLLLTAFPSAGQYAPTQTIKLIVAEPFGLNHTDFTARFPLNTQALVATGLMQPDGDDIRFSTGCPGSYLDYWIETGMNTDSTVIWVRIPQLPANDSLPIWMYFGDSLAPGPSNFNTTFPNALITTGDVFTSNVQHYGWLKVNAGHTLYITGGQPLIIHAGKVEINGSISGKGKGYTAPTTAGSGNGPGGGGTSTNSGAGGGGYGGAGGLGGYDAGDTPGAGGIAYGTSAGTDIDMGSAGGTTDNTQGGNGGGGLTILSQIAHISGNIIMDGDDGVQPGSSRGGGGGAGGGIMIVSETLTMDGSLSAKGGAGSPGTSTANDSGGGGGGGRIKLFHGTGYTATGTMNVNGGIGGPYGSPAAMPGTNGTIHVAASTFKQNVIFPVQPFGALTNVEHYLCPGDSIFVNGTWYSQGALLYDTLTNMLGCDSVIQVTIIPVTVDTAVTLSAFTITAVAGSATYQWYDCNASAIVPGATGQSFSPSVSGLYACIVNQYGCSAMSSCYYVTSSDINNVSTLSGVRVYPNPAGSQMHIEGLSAGKTYHVRLSDLTGRCHYETTTRQTETFTLPLSSCDPGIYFLCITEQETLQMMMIKVMKI